ncbi:hypothetical protein [Psychrobacillus lasiicapitis]|uniref:Uncharacterized protein n=1 Tax=Psychrobacillus lasiicapitis TaxID=1636719 RepID=A0A544THS3_9BACI|nr:hypothetical protein [Psychrobacillus lasiicapitis]TQR16996.1 hypothetical protein FG382_02250 [Psychrobacillus lasiicapitis]GGA25425.1 hypothetical protein GCM10011384_13290 [Psychrobacillus lasiicapitis]
MSDRKKEETSIDELLQNMPKFTDHRSKEEVYNRVKIEIEAQVKEEKRKIMVMSFSKWMPFVVSVAAILLLTFLVSSYTNQEEKSMSNDSTEQSENLRTMDAKEESETVMEEDAAPQQANEMTAMTKMLDTPIELIPLHKTTSVYEESINGGTVFHFSLVENALTVPISIIIPKERMEADFPDGTPTSLQLYERYAAQIDEEALGFMEYHPYKGYFVVEGNVLKHYLPNDHGYDRASGSTTTYEQSLNEIFTDFDSILPVNEDGTTIVWDQAGEIKEPRKLPGSSGHYNFYIYHASNGEDYLSPSFGNTYKSLSEALLAMKDVENDFYTSVIPSNVSYTYSEQNGTAVVRFDEQLDLEALDPFAATRLIEAFALTAASFGEEVKLENLVQQQWAEFDLTKSLPVPLGPNGFIMSDK